MREEIAWIFAGVALVIVLCMWHWIVWRELESRMKVLRRLQRQVKLSRDAAKQSNGLPYDESAKHSLETSLDVYREAANEYNLLRCKPYCRIPSMLMGFRTPREEIMQDDRTNGGTKNEKETY